VSKLKLYFEGQSRCPKLYMLNLECRIAALAFNFADPNL